MQSFILENFELYGPLAVFFLLLLTGIGVPLGEDLIVIPAGAFVAQGHMNFWWAALGAYAGVVISDMMWYGICYRYGTRLLHRRFLKRAVHPRRLLEAKHQMEQRGAWMVLMARFVPGSRTTAITCAGILHMSFWKFALATAVGVLFTVPMQIGIGILSVRVVGVDSITELLRLILGLMVLAVAIMLGAAAWRRHVSSRRRAPRAKARWLRRFRVRRRRAKMGEVRGSKGRTAVM